MSVKILKASDGKYLTNGVVICKVVRLAEGTKQSNWYEITKEEYDWLTHKEAVEDPLFWDDFTNTGNRTDYSYAFANWSQSEIIPSNTLRADKVVYMFMECKNLMNADKIKVLVKNNNPSMQGFCMGNVKMINSPSVMFRKSDGLPTPVVRTWVSAYANCVSMESCSIYLGDGTQDPIGMRNSMQNTFVNNKSLKHLTFEGKGSPLYLDLSDCKELSYESMMSLRDSLMDVSSASSGNYDIKIAAESFALLNDEDKSSFGVLGWNLVVMDE